MFIYSHALQLNVFLSLLESDIAFFKMNNKDASQETGPTSGSAAKSRTAPGSGAGPSSKDSKGLRPCEISKASLAKVRASLER